LRGIKDELVDFIMDKHQLLQISQHFQQLPFSVFFLRLLQISDAPYCVLPQQFSLPPSEILHLLSQVVVHLQQATCTFVRRLGQKAIEDLLALGSLLPDERLVLQGTVHA